MDTIRFANPKKRWEVILRYIMYPVICIFLLEIIVTITLLGHLTLKQIVLYAMPTMLKYIILSVVPLTFWYGGSRVMSIECDCDNKVLNLRHYNWLFCRRQKLILWENLSYRVYHIRAPFLFHKVTLIQINDKNSKRTLVFASGLGWKRKQVDEIACKLKIIKEPIVYL